MDTKYQYIFSIEQISEKIKKNPIFQIKIESLIDYYFNPHQF
jgi:hypothetical protein